MINFAPITSAFSAVIPYLTSIFSFGSLASLFTVPWNWITSFTVFTTIGNSAAWGSVSGFFTMIGNSTAWVSISSFLTPGMSVVGGHLYLFGGLIVTMIGGGSFWWLHLSRPKVIVVEYSLFEINTLTLTFLIAVAFLIAYFFLSDSKKHRNTLLLAAAPIGFSLYVKRLVLAHKWNLNNIFDQISLFVSGNFNSEQLLVIAFTVLLFIFMVIACSAELSLVNLLLGFIFPSLDALISKSLYVISMPLLSPFINNAPVGDISLLSLITSVFVAYVAFCCFILFVQLLTTIYRDVEKDFYNSDFYRNMDAQVQ